MLSILGLSSPSWSREDLFHDLTCSFRECMHFLFRHMEAHRSSKRAACAAADLCPLWDIEQNINVRLIKGSHIRWLVSGVQRPDVGGGSPRGNTCFTSTLDDVGRLNLFIVPSHPKSVFPTSCLLVYIYILYEQTRFTRTCPYTIDLCRLRYFIHI